MSAQCADESHGAPPLSPAWVSGEILEFSAVPEGPDDVESLDSVSFRAIIECRGAGKFAFALPGNPYRRLRLSTTGEPEWDPGLASSSSRGFGTRESNWSVEHCGDLAKISIASKKGGLVYLAPAARNSEAPGDDHLGLAPGCLLAADAREARWRVAVAPRESGQPQPGVGTLSREPAVAGLSLEDLQHFVEHGYAVVRKAVPVDVWATAKSYINGRLGALAIAGAASEAPVATIEEAPETADPAGEEHARHPLCQAWGGSAWQLLALGRCAEVRRVLEQLVGREGLDPHFGAQVALRFPGVRDDLVAAGAAVRQHVTGRDWHTDGLRQGKKHPFSLLVGVALSDMSEEDQGNLCVWPGSHFFAQARSRWPDGRFLRPNGWERTDGPLPDLGRPVQLRLQPGDIVLAHSELAHCGGPLVGPDIRYMVYLRLKHRAWQRMRDEERFAADMWCDLEGVSPTLAKTPAVLGEAEQWGLQQ